MSKDDSVLQISICNRIVLGQKASGALEDIRAERTSSRDVRRLKGCHESAPLYNWLCVLILSHLCHGLFVSAETKARCGARICQAASKTGHGFHSKLLKTTGFVGWSPIWNTANAADNTIVPKSRLFLDYLYPLGQSASVVSVQYKQLATSLPTVVSGNRL